MKTDNPESFKKIAAVSSTSAEHSDEDGKRVVQYTVTAAAQSGILPPSQELAEYDRIIPDGAERIMQMAEKQQQHRFDRDKALLDERKRGQYLGFIAALVLIGVGTWLAVIGQSAVSCTIFGGGAAAIIGLFIVQSRRSAANK